MMLFTTVTLFAFLMNNGLCNVKSVISTSSALMTSEMSLNETSRPVIFTGLLIVMFSTEFPVNSPSKINSSNVIESNNTPFSSM